MPIVVFMVCLLFIAIVAQIALSSYCCDEKSLTDDALISQTDNDNDREIPPAPKLKRKYVKRGTTKKKE